MCVCVCHPGAFVVCNFVIDSNEVAENPAAVDTLETEGNVSTDAILPWYEWLKSKGTTMKIVSRLNPAPEQIERIEI